MVCLYTVLSYTTLRDTQPYWQPEADPEYRLNRVGYDTAGQLTNYTTRRIANIDQTGAPSDKSSPGRNQPNDSQYPAWDVYREQARARPSRYSTRKRAAGAQHTQEREQ